MTITDIHVSKGNKFIVGVDSPMGLDAFVEELIPIYKKATVRKNKDIIKTEVSGYSKPAYGLGEDNIHTEIDIYPSAELEFVIKKGQFPQGNYSREGVLEILGVTDFYKALRAYMCDNIEFLDDLHSKCIDGSLAVRK